MAADPKQHLYALIEHLNEDEARDLLHALDSEGEPAPLTESDVLLDVPLLPSDETADALIETVRRWRREGGDA